MFQVMPALLVAGGSFAGMQYFWSNHVEYSLVDIVAAIFSLLTTAAFLKFWKPKVIETVAQAPAPVQARAAAPWLGTMAGMEAVPGLESARRSLITSMNWRSPAWRPAAR